MHVDHLSREAEQRKLDAQEAQQRAEAQRSEASGHLGSQLAGLYADLYVRPSVYRPHRRAKRWRRSSSRLTPCS